MILAAEYLKEKTRIYNSEYREKNREQLKIAKSEYYQKNKDYCIQKSRLWRLNNQQKSVQNAVNYKRKRFAVDVLFKFRHGISSLIGKSIKASGFRKTSKTADILGCSIPFFKSYIEQRFQDGMTWEDRSEWHLDHIIPMASAKNKSDILKLNHYTNFRPLWAKENILKSNKLSMQLELV